MVFVDVHVRCRARWISAIVWVHSSQYRDRQRKTGESWSSYVRRSDRACMRPSAAATSAARTCAVANVQVLRCALALDRPEGQPMCGLCARSLFLCPQVGA